MSERLDSWKDIAAYLGRDVRTLQRWARARQLPVHHLPGGGSKPRVFALKSELDGWIRAGVREGHRVPASIAVLRFANLAGSAGGQRFGDGLADDLINALVRVAGLHVTAHTSSFAFPRAGHDVRRIGARLGVEWLVEGSVRRDGKRVRVSAQLVSTRDGFHVWSGCYDRDVTDVFAIQDEIARSIALVLKVKLAPGHPPPRPTEDLAAYEHWVNGRLASQQYTPSAFAQALRCYEAAIERDPSFARPYFGLAELLFHSLQFGLATSSDAAARARQAMARALELDDHFGEAYALCGVFRGVLGYDWSGADLAFQRALDLCPGSASVLMQHSWFHLVPRMRVAEAVDQAQQAVALDPLSPPVLGRFGLVLIVARQYARAVEQCGAAVALAPRLWWLRWFYGTALLMDGQLSEGLRQLQKVYRQMHQPTVIGGMALVYGVLLHKRARARALLHELEHISATAHVPPLVLAWAHLGAGDDGVFRWLDKAIDARDPAVIQLPSMPFYDDIRDDPRFPALLARMNLA